MKYNISGIGPTGRLLRPVGFLVPILFSLLFFAGCSPDSEDQKITFDRGPFLENTTSSVIIPAYTNYASRCQDLKNASDQLIFTEGVDAGQIQGLQELLKLTYLDWQHASLFDFGPAMDRALLATTNTYPTDTVKIIAAFTNENWTPGLPATLSNIGLPALDYLLNHSSAEEIATEMNNDSFRIDHLKRLVDYLQSESFAVLTAWEDGFKTTFVASTGTEEGSSIGLLLNSFNQVYEKSIRKEKLGLPNGIMTFSETPQPTLVEAPFAASWSIELMHEALIGCENFYFGDLEQGASQQIGLDDYLQSLGDVEYGAGLDDAISGQLTAAKAAVLTMNDPLADYVVESQAATYDVFAELQALVVLWKVDMMSSLGVLITYQDNDND
tara:strand:- start:99 stop:1250 length:1152 start_codon:yes stop_codon:yes gene_type:complete